MLDHIQDVRHMIDRMDLPARVARLVAKIEAETGPLDKLEDSASLEVRRLLQLVGGETLCAAILVRLLQEFPEEKEDRLVPHPTERIRSQKQRWKAVADQQDGLTLLLIDDHYLAFGDQAQRIAEGAGAHTIRIGRDDAVSLPLTTQPDWVAKLQSNNLDVVLACETTDGADTINVLELGTTDESRVL